MQVLSFRHGSASLTVAALGASGLAHAAGLAAFVTLYDPEPSAPVSRPVVIEIVAAAPAAAGEPPPTAVAEPGAAIPDGRTPDIQMDEPLLPEPPGVQMATADAVGIASLPHEVVPAPEPPTAPAKTSTAVPAENKPSIFEIGIAALPPAAGFAPLPRRKPPVPAEETAVVTPVATAAERPPEHSLPLTATSESAAAPGAKQIRASVAEAAPDTGGEDGSSESASLPQDGESLVAADYAHASLGNQPPRYPRRARRDGLEGRVVLSARVSAAGSIVSLEVVRSSGHEILDRAAVRAVNRWSVRPARQGSKPVPSEIRIPILFRLTDG